MTEAFDGYTFVPGRRHTTTCQTCGAPQASHNWTCPGCNYSRPYPQVTGSSPCPSCQHASWCLVCPNLAPGVGAGPDPSNTPPPATAAAQGSPAWIARCAAHEGAAAAARELDEISANIAAGAGPWAQHRAAVLRTSIAAARTALEQLEQLEARPPCAHERRRVFEGCYGYSLWLSDQGREVIAVFWCLDCGALGIPDAQNRIEPMTWEHPQAGRP